MTHRRTFAVAIALVAAACSDPAGPKPTPRIALSVVARIGELTLGDTTRVTARRADGEPFADSAFVRYSSSDTSIVAVDAGTGLATVVAEGSADIVAEAPNATGSTSLRGTLVPLASDVALKSLAFGFNHGCGLDAAGTAYCFGSRSDAVGAGTASSFVKTPLPVIGDLRFATVDADNWGSCGLTTDGLVYCWGAGSPGTARSVPTRVIFGGDSTKRATAVRVHADGGGCIIETGGGSWCWGNALYGALGFVEGDPVGRIAVPRPIPGGLLYRELKPGFDHSCGVTIEGAVYCVGTTWMFHGTAPSGRATLPELIAVPAPMHSIATGWESDCALDADGAAWCWGGNNHGELGTGAPPTGSNSFASFAPARVVGGHRFTSVKMFNYSACGLTSDGELWCWGQIGRGVVRTSGNATISTVPVLVSHTRRFVTFALTSRSVCGVVADGAVFCGGTTLDGFGIR